MIQVYKKEEIVYDTETEIYESTELKYKFSFFGIPVWTKVYSGKCDAKGDKKSSKGSSVGFNSRK